MLIRLLYPPGSPIDLLRAPKSSLPDTVQCFQLIPGGRPHLRPLPPPVPAAPLISPCRLGALVAVTVSRCFLAPTQSTGPLSPRRSPTGSGTDKAQAFVWIWCWRRKSCLCYPFVDGGQARMVLLGLAPD